MAGGLEYRDYRQFLHNRDNQRRAIPGLSVPRYQIARSQASMNPSVFQAFCFAVLLVIFPLCLSVSAPTATFPSLLLCIMAIFPADGQQQGITSQNSKDTASKLRGKRVQKLDAAM